MPFTFPLAPIKTIKGNTIIIVNESYNPFNHKYVEPPILGKHNAIISNALDHNVAFLILEGLYKRDNKRPAKKRIQKTCKTNAYLGAI